MPAVLFDGRWVRPGMTGVGVVAYNMLAAVARCSSDCGVILNPGPVPEAFSGLRIFPCAIDLTRHPRTEVFEQLGIPRLCKRLGYRAFVSFEGRVPVFHPGLCTFSYIHDLASFTLRDSHSIKYRAFLTFSLHTSRLFADRIVTVSQAVREELMLRLRVPDSKILVVRNADSGLERCEPQPLARLPERFFLAVGMTNPRKNMACLLEGFSRYRALHPGAELLLTGNPELIERESRSLPKDGVRSLGFVREGELRFLYRKAEGLVFPSKGEGFGLPMMDAYREGCPVFCSDIPVFREVMGEYARYFDPGSPRALADQLALGRREPPGAIGLPPGYDWDQAARTLLNAATAMID